jgi:hypothetical protein
MKITVRDSNYELMNRLASNGINLEYSDVNTLRRAQMTLHRWAELECGDGNDHASWAIERDDDTELPYMCTYPHNGASRRHRIPDREKGALRRIAAICSRVGIHFYHQTDPRGCALYLSATPLKDHDYTHGVAVC